MILLVVTVPRRHQPLVVQHLIEMIGVDHWERYADRADDTPPQSVELGVTFQDADDHRLRRARRFLGRIKGVSYEWL